MILRPLSQPYSLDTSSRNIIRPSDRVINEVIISRISLFIALLSIIIESFIRRTSRERITMNEMSRKMTDSEAFKKRKEETTEVIVADYAVDERGERRRRGGGEGEGHGDATKRISSLLTNSNERRASLHVENAKKQVTATIAALEIIENTSYEDLNASTWKMLQRSID